MKKFVLLAYGFLAGSCVADVVFVFPRMCPADTFLRDVIPPCLVVNVTDSSSNTTSILKCPVTGQYYKTHTWEKFDVDARNLVSVFVTTNLILGIVSSDLMGYVSVTAKQGKVTFGYPFDYQFPSGFHGRENNNNFLKQNIMRNMVDGDFVSYISDGTNFSAWATFAAKDNKLHWHDYETFAVLNNAPIPDSDADFLYHRMQATNTCMTISGGVYAKNSGYRPFEKYGVEGANSHKFEILRDVDWANNLLSGVSKWTHEFKPTSVRDPRKFYVRLDSGERAFAMVLDNHKQLLSPITHAVLTVDKAAIQGFEPIDDGAYPDGDCYSKNEVDGIWKDYTEERGWIDKTLAEVCGEHYIPGHPIKSLWDKFKYWLLILYLPGLLCKRTRRYLLIPVKFLKRIVVDWIFRPVLRIIAFCGKNRRNNDVS